MSTEALGAVRELLSTVSGLAASTEEKGVVPDSTIDDLAEAGLFRMLQPARYGGLEASPLDFFTAVRELSGACGSTGWVASILGVHPWHVALFSAQAQDEVWGEDPDTRVCSSYAPTGKVETVEGGYRISGRWSFSSGCLHSSWALLGGLVHHASRKSPEMCTFLVPLGDYKVDAVWDAVGLNGTGSHDLVVEDAFVPSHRVLSSRLTVVGRVPGHQVNDAPLYRLPFGTFLPHAVTVPLVGMTMGAYREHVKYARTRVRAAHRETTGKGLSAVDDPLVQVRVAETAHDLDAARVLIEHNLREMLSLVEQAKPVPMSLRTVVRRDLAASVRRAVRAADRVFDGSGGRVLDSSGVVQRLWRDVHAGGAHALNDYERVLRLFGKLELGLSVQDPML